MGNISDSGLLVQDRQNISRMYGEAHNVGDLSGDLTTADTWYDITGTITDGTLYKFTLTDGVLIYNGPDGIPHLFNGSVNLTTNKTADINFGLFLNDDAAPQDDCDTRLHVPVVGKDSSMSCTSIVVLNKGDEIRVKAKSSEDTTTLTVQHLSITLVSL